MNASSGRDNDSDVRAGNRPKAIADADAVADADMAVDAGRCHIGCVTLFIALLAETDMHIYYAHVCMSARACACVRASDVPSDAIYNISFHFTYSLICCCHAHASRRSTQRTACSGGKRVASVRQACGIMQSTVCPTDTLNTAAKQVNSI